MKNRSTDIFQIMGQVKFFFNPRGFFDVDFKKKHQKNNRSPRFKAQVRFFESD